MPLHHRCLADELDQAITRLQPAGLVQTAPGDWRVLQAQRFAHHPGQPSPFGWPVTGGAGRLHHPAPAALRAMARRNVGRRPWLHHAHLSAALNLKLLNPREVVASAEAAYRAGQAPLPAVEGFIRQILGWRQYLQRPSADQRQAISLRADAIRAQADRR